MGASGVGSYEGVPHEGIGVLEVVEKPSGVVKIGKRREVENSAVQEEVLWVVARDGTQRLRVNLLELSHADCRRFL